MDEFQKAYAKLKTLTDPEKTKLSPMDRVKDTLSDKLIEYFRQFGLPQQQFLDLIKEDELFFKTVHEKKFNDTTIRRLADALEHCIDYEDSNF